MKIRKNILLGTMLIAGISLAYGQGNPGIDYYEAGDYPAAKEYFLKKGNMDAADRYYLGEIYFKEKKTDSAQFHFSKGLELDPSNLLNTVGLAKVQLGVKGTDEQLNSIGKDRKNRKNAHLLAAVAEAYLDNNRPSDAANYLERSISANKQSPYAYVLKGDIAAKAGNTGEAATNYESAIYFAPAYKAPYVKLARLYENIRTQVALDYLRKVIQLDPQYIPGHLTLSQINYRKGFYPDALVAYEKYLSLVAPQPKDYELYASILYFNKKHAQVIDAIKKAPTNLVMNRLKMYSLFELGDYAAALESADAFFKTANKNDLITQDYTYYAQLLSNNKRYGDAAQAYVGAYEADSTNLEYLTQAANAFERADDFPNAIKYLQKSLEKNPENSLADLYALGAANYSAGTRAEAFFPDSVKDKLTKENYLKEADKIFAEMIEKYPDHYLGYFMRARANFALDPEAEEGLAVPYYQQALEIMLPNLDERKNDILESYRYLGFYYLGQNNVPQAKNFWGKVLEISPTDETALQVINSLR